MPWKDPVQATVPQIRDGYMAAVYYGQRCGGDFYDFLRVSAERVLFGLFDIAGDLKRSRAIVVALQEKFRTAGERLLGPDDANEAEALLELWLELNRTIMTVAGGVRSCPAFLGCYNDDVGTLSYINSGHIPPLIRDPQDQDAQAIAELTATALPLGLFSHSVPDSSVTALGSGNTLLMVSRGIIEAKYRGEEYGLARVREYLHEAQFGTAHETCVGILSRVQQFMRTAPTHNDVTALSLVRSS